MFWTLVDLEGINKHFAFNTVDFYHKPLCTLSHVGLQPLQDKQAAILLHPVRGVFVSSSPIHSLSRKQAFCRGPTSASISAALSLVLGQPEVICIFWRNWVLEDVVASMESLVCVEPSWAHSREF